MTKLLSGARSFAHRHDDLPAFHAAYLVLTLLSAALFSLGVFALLIVAHMSLDFVKYREVHKFTLKGTVEGIVRESLVDVVLLFVGLTFAVYFHHTMLIAGVSGLIRAEMTILSAFGMLIPKFTILHHIVEVTVHVGHYIRHPHPRIGKGWSWGEKALFITCIGSVLLLLVAGPATGAGHAHVISIMVEELAGWLH